MEIFAHNYDFLNRFPLTLDLFSVYNDGEGLVFKTVTISGSNSCPVQKGLAVCIAQFNVEQAMMLKRCQLSDFHLVCILTSCWLVKGYAYSELLQCLHLSSVAEHFLAYLFFRFACVCYGRFIAVLCGFNLSRYVQNRWW
jgi:hypothetical protein